MDRHQRKSLGTQACSHQVLKDMRDHLYFLTHNWDKYVDLEENPTDTTLEQNIPEGYFLKTLKDFCTASELLLACSQNIMDWTTASIAACRSSGRKEVLKRCYGDPTSRPIKADLLNTGFASTTLFGSMPESDRHQILWDPLKKAKLKVNIKEKTVKASDSGVGPSGYTSNVTKRKSDFPTPPVTRPAHQTFPSNHGCNQSNRGGFSHRVVPKIMTIGTTKTNKKIGRGERSESGKSSSPSPSPSSGSFSFSAGDHRNVPLPGDLPPREDFFPFPEIPPLVEEFFQPEEVLPVLSLNLDFSMTMRDRWLSLKDPPDTVATSIATEGLWLDLLQEPPMVSRCSPPISMVTHPDKFPVLKPFVRDWEQRGILTRKCIPAYVFFSRFFYVSKKGGKFRTILDLSIFNHLCKNPFLCDGGLKLRSATHHSGNVGLICRHHGCLSNTNDSSEL